MELNSSALPQHQNEKNANIKYFISSCENQTHNLSRSQSHACAPAPRMTWNCIIITEISLFCKIQRIKSISSQLARLVQAERDNDSCCFVQPASIDLQDDITSIIYFLKCYIAHKCHVFIQRLGTTKTCIFLNRKDS